MSLFHQLHRVAVGLTWLGVAGVGLLAWQHRTLFTPPLDYCRALTLHEGFKQQVRGALTGRVDRILGETTFRLRTTGRQLANVRLTGIAAPALENPAALPADIQQAIAARKLLGELVLSNEVQVTVTHLFAPGAVLGLVEVNGTNVNLAMVRAGVAHAEPEFLRGLPLRLRYDLLHQTRLARARARQAEAAAGAAPAPGSTMPLTTTNVPDIVP